MKSLQESIKESLEQSYLTEATNEISESLIQECTDWIVANYRSRYYGEIKPDKIKFAKKLNAEGKLVASCPRVKTLCLSKDAPSITNGKFVWDNIKFEFCIKDNKNITSLEGCPEEVDDLFELHWCPKLTSLEGGPLICNNRYDVEFCENLTSLKGAPIFVHHFLCGGENKITTLKDLNIKTKDTHFDFANCKTLISLEGIPSTCHSLCIIGCTGLTKASFIQSKLKEVYGHIDAVNTDLTKNDFESIKVGGIIRTNANRAEKLI